MNSRIRKQVQCLTVNGYKPEVEAGKCTKEIAVFRGYTNLHSLNIFHSSEMSDACEVLFRNNRLITSFTCDDMYFPMDLLLSLRNLERLLISSHSSFMCLHVLPSLSALRHLTLICQDNDIEHINNVLQELGSSHLEGLALVDVSLNQRTLPTIKSMQNLKLLSVSSLNLYPLSTEDLPTTLQQLKLDGFLINKGQIASLVERLQHLKNLLLKDCQVFHNDCNFDQMAAFITAELQANHLQRQLIVSIQFKCGRPSKVL